MMITKVNIPKRRMRKLWKLIYPLVLLIILLSLTLPTAVPAEATSISNVPINSTAAFSIGGGGAANSTSAYSTLGAYTITINKPATTAANDVLVACIAVQTYTAGPADLTPPSDWVLIRHTDGSQAWALDICTYYKVAGASEPSSYTWTDNSGNYFYHQMSGGITRYTGVDINHVLDVSADNQGTGTTLTAPAVTTTYANERVITFFGTYYNLQSTMGAPSGMTQLYTVNQPASGSSTWPSIAVDEMTQGTAGNTGNKAVTAVPLSGQAVYWTTQTFALKPAPTVGFQTTGQSIAEGGSTEVGIRLIALGPSDGPVTVNYTVSGTATPGSDYTISPSNSVTIAAGSYQANFLVTTMQDNLYEPNDTIVITLTSAVGAVWAAYTTYTITITDSDGPAPTPVIAAASRTFGVSPAVANAPKSISISKPGGTTTGSFLLASLVIYAASDAQIAGTGMTPVDGWTLIHHNYTGDIHIFTYYRIASSSDPSTYTWTYTTYASNDWRAVGGITRYTGVDRNSPVDTATDGSGIAPVNAATGYAPANAPVLYPNYANDKIVSIFGATENLDVTGYGAFEAPSGMTKQYETTYYADISGWGPVAWPSIGEFDMNNVPATGWGISPQETVNMHWGGTNVYWGAQTIALKTSQLSVNNVSKAEGNSGSSVLDFTVSLDSPTDVPVTFNWSTANGTATAGSDYILSSGNGYTIPAGQTSYTLGVPIYVDTALESNETFYFNVTGVTGATVANGQGVGTILNDDSSLSINSPSISEGNTGTTNLNFTVTLTPACSLPVSFDYHDISGGTATQGTDFQHVAGTLNIAAGSTTATISVPVYGDTVYEPNETFIIYIYNPVNAQVSGTGQGTGTILNDDAATPSISINDVSKVEGNSGTANMVFTVTLSNTFTSAVSVQYATANGTATAGSDYTSTSGTLSILAGSTTGSISVPIIGDTAYEPNETFNVNLSNPTNATISDSQGVGTITNDDTLTMSINDVSQNEGTGTGIVTNFVFTVSLNGAAPSTVTVHYATADGTATVGSDYNGVADAILTFNTGDTSKTITIQVNADNVYETDETFYVKLSNTSGATIVDGQGMGTILNDDPVPTYTLTMAVSPTGSGSASDTTNTSPYTSGTVVNISAVAAAGYHFVNWTASPTGGTFGNAATASTTYTMPASAETVTANFAPNTYTVSFDAQGGTPATPTPITVTYGSTYGTLPTVTKTGYTFNGWFTAATGGTQVTSSTTVTITAAQTLYAQWTANSTYTVTYNGNGSTDGNVPTDSTAYYQGDTVTVLGNTGSLVKTDYTFSGWNTAANGSGTSYNAGDTFTMGASNVTLYAKWAPNPDQSQTDSSTYLTVVSSGYSGMAQTFLAGVTGSLYQVSFYIAGGGNVSVEIYPVNESTGQPIYSPPPPASVVLSIPTTAGWANATFTSPVSVTAGTHYAFLISPPNARECDFYHSSGDAYSGGQAFTFDYGSTIFTATGYDLTFKTFVQPSATTYTVTYNANGATSGSVPVDSNSYANGATVTVLGNTGSLVKTGYTFAGWNTQANGSGTTYTAGQTFTMGSNVTLYAKWTINQYTISFNSNGGSTVTAITQDYGTAVTAPADPTRTGYTFAGWYSDSGLTTPYTFSTMPAQNITLYAKWTAVSTYTVTFDSQGGSAVTSLTNVTSGSTITKPADPTKTGYTFGGWYKEASCTNAWNFSTDTVTSDITLYAKWTANTCTVSFDAQGGTPATPTPITVTYGSTYGTLPTVTKTGYTFNGWFTAATGGTQVTSSTTVTITAAQTLYAQWTALATYTVTYNANGATSGSVPVDSNSYANGATVTVLGNTGSLVKTGYTFAGWNTQANGSGTTYTAGQTFTMGSNVTLYAKWTINQYTISFNSNGGSSVTAITQDYGTAVTAPADPTRTGYTFAGWYSDSGLTTPYTFSTMPAQNITLYAKWTANTYTVSFNVQGGTPTPSNQTVAYGGLVTEPAAPTKTGYTFGGWFTDTTYTTQWNLSTDTVTGSVTLYAKWTANTCTVSFDAQGGTPAPSDQEVAYGALVTEPTAPARTGYTFSDWFTDNTTYATQWDFSTDTVTGDVTLYAKWTINQYTISFDSNGGSSVTAIIQDYGTTVTAPADPTRTGYTFAGWYSDSGLTTPYTFSTMPAQNITLYAKWTAITYTVTFDSQGGTSVTSQTVAYGGLVTEPTAPTRTGYTCNGWFTDTTYATQWNFSTDTVSGDMTLYARWTINSYTVSFDSQSGSAVDPQTVDYGGLVTEPTDPTRDGYTFGGWYKEATCTNTWDFSTDTITVDATLYAKWTINQYTISFDSNGGSTVTAITQDYGTAVTAPADPTRTGYTFNGWYSDPELTTSYTFNTMPAQDITLYAQWTANTYTVSFDAQGGTPATPTPITVTYDSTYGTLPDVTWTGRTFDGWFTASTGGTQVTSSTTVTITSDQTLYAHWTFIEYTLTINVIEGSGTVNKNPDQTTYHYSDNVTLTANPASGYHLEAWGGALSGTTNPASITISGDTTVTVDFHAVSSLLYTGQQLVITPDRLILSAHLTGPADIVGGQTITFTLDANPTTGEAGIYSLGTATTNSKGDAVLTISSTDKWIDDTYTVSVSFAGSGALEHSEDDATLTIAVPGSAATGGGWYTLSGSGRVNFGFTVKAVPNTSDPVQYKGQVLVINNGKWRLKGTLNSYGVNNNMGAANGTGTLYIWNSDTLSWDVAQSDVAFTITFVDNGSGGGKGKNKTVVPDQFGITLSYTPADGQPALPNSTPTDLKGGEISMQDISTTPPPTDNPGGGKKNK